jgi:hypothetical protein
LDGRRLDGRRSIVPPNLLARADIPRALRPRSPSSRTSSLATTIAAASPSRPQDAPISRNIRRFVELSLDTWRGPRQIAQPVARSKWADYPGPAWDHERRRHRWQKVRSSV